MQIERILGRRFRDGDPEKEGGGGDDKAAEEAAAAAKVEADAADAAKALADEEADKIARGDVVDDGATAKGEDEGDGTAAKPKDEGDGTAAKSEKTTSTMVPKSRLDTKNRMLSDAQARIEELEQKVATTVPAAAAAPAADAPTADSKMEAAEKEYTAARKDGNVDAELQPCGASERSRLSRARLRWTAPGPVLPTTPWRLLATKMSWL
jgi:colicin import membrane protein